MYKVQDFKNVLNDLEGKFAFILKDSQQLVVNYKKWWEYKLFNKNGQIFSKTPKIFKVFGVYGGKNVSFHIFLAPRQQKMCHYRPKYP